MNGSFHSDSTVGADTCTSVTSSGERENIRSTKHSTHETEHEDRSSDLGPVLEDGKRNKRFGVDVPFPESENAHQETAKYEEEDDSPVCPSAMLDTML